MIAHLDFAILRYSGRCLLIALGLASIVSRTEAVEPKLLDYFQACGIGRDAFAKFTDDRQVADEELEVICRIAVRLRDCPADRLQRLISNDIPSIGDRESAGQLPSPAEAKDHRGRTFELHASLVSVEPVENQGGEPLWRCTVTLSEFSSRAVVYTAEVPQKLRTGSTGQRVAASGVFVKYVPGAPARPVAVFVAPRLQWRKESLLGRLGMDFAMLEGIRDNAPLTAADRDAFYRLLLLTREADPALLRRDADRLDGLSPGLPELFGDAAAQRGRLLQVAGTALRVARVPIIDPAVASRLRANHYVEIDLLAEGSQDNPLVFCTLESPSGMPLSESPSGGESIEITGFFLKNWQYPTALSAGEKASHPGSLRALQTAPLVIGPMPLWKPAVAAKKGPAATAESILVVLAMIGVCLLLWHFRQSDQEFSRHVIGRE